MEFKSEDFTGLPFNVYPLPEGADILQVWPMLRIYPEFKPEVQLGIDQVRAFRYIGFLYQQRTPLLAIVNFMKRKITAAKLADFPMQDTEFEPEYSEAIRGKNVLLNKQIIRFCRLQHSTDWSELMVYEGVLYDELLNLTNETDAEVRKKILANVDTIKKRMEKNQFSLLSGDSNSLLITDLLDELETEQLDLDPESIALKIRDGIDPLKGFNPYEEKQ